METDRVQSKSLKTRLGIMLIVIGFSSITLYMGSTIFYPMVNFSEFVGLALHSSIQQVLLNRYVGYIPFMTFGVLSVMAGSWFCYTRKEIDNTILAMISMPLLTVFTILILKIF